MKSTKLNQESFALEQCPVCGAQMKLTVIDNYTIPKTPTKPEITIHSVECYQCTSCDECVLNPEQIKAMEAQAIDTYREVLNLLSKDEITDIVKGFKSQGLSIDLLERILKFNPRSFYRWTNNLSIQSDQADTLLRLIRRHPEMLFELAEERGVKIPA